MLESGVYIGIMLVFFFFSSLLVLEAGEDTECVLQSPWVQFAVRSSLQAVGKNWHRRNRCWGFPALFVCLSWPFWVGTKMNNIGSKPCFLSKLYLLGFSFSSYWTPTSLRRLWRWQKLQPGTSASPWKYGRRGCRCWSSWRGMMWPSALKKPLNMWNLRSVLA